MNALDLAAFRATPLQREPFDFVIVRGFIRAEARQALLRDYPPIESGGSLPLAGLTYGPAFCREFIDELEGPDFRAAIEEKFKLDLAGRPTTLTVRGHCSPKDGRIHTDSTSKIVTVLIYMNSAWQESGGRLRLLRSPDNLEDMVAEVPPTEGTLVVFRRCDNSYHGHKPFVGPRRVVQFNWVTGSGSRGLTMLRHRISAALKKVFVRGPAGSVAAADPAPEAEY